MPPMRMRFSPTTFKPTASHIRRIWRFLPSFNTKRSCSGFCQSTCAGSKALPSSDSPWRSKANLSSGKTCCTFCATTRPPWAYSTRTRYSLSTVLSSPMIWRATRPSCVNTNKPVESISKRPAGAKPRNCCGLKLRLLRSSRQRLRGCTKVTAAW